MMAIPAMLMVPLFTRKHVMLPFPALFGARNGRGALLRATGFNDIVKCQIKLDIAIGMVGVAGAH